MYTLEGVSSVANITAYEGVSLKRGLPFSVCNVFIVSKGNLFYFYLAVERAELYFYPSFFSFGRSVFDIMLFLWCRIL